MVNHTGSQEDPNLCHIDNHVMYGLHKHLEDVDDEYGWVLYSSPLQDMVNHPPHYGHHPSGVECITIAEWYNFNTGNAIKYLWRAHLKGDLLEDLKKARWYVDREIQRLEREYGTLSNLAGPINPQEAG